MVRLLAVIAITGIVACNLTPAASRDALIYRPGDLIPLGVLHAEARIDSMSVGWASEELALMNEPRLHPAAIEGDVFRMLYRPSFRSAIAIRVTKTGSACTMIRKEAVQRPPKEVGREPGGVILLERQPDSLVRADSFPVGEKDCEELRLAVDSSRLDLEPDFLPGPDGDTYLFEHVRGGRYLARQAWSPDSLRSARYLKAGTAFLRWAPTGRR